MAHIQHRLLERQNRYWSKAMLFLSQGQPKIYRKQNLGRDPFNQNFRKFRSKNEWIGSVQPEKFRTFSTFRGGPLFSVGPVRSKCTVPFDHSDPFPIPGPRCSVSSIYKMEENSVNSRSIGVTRTSMYSYLWSSFHIKNTISCICHSILCICRSLMCICHSIMCICHSILCICHSVMCICHSVVCICHSVMCICHSVVWICQILI